MATGKRERRLCRGHGQDLKFSTLVARVSDAFVSRRLALRLFTTKINPRRCVPSPPTSRPLKNRNATILPMIALFYCTLWKSRDILNFEFAAIKLASSLFAADAPSLIQMVLAIGFWKLLAYVSYIRNIIHCISLRFLVYFCLNYYFCYVTMARRF